MPRSVLRFQRNRDGTHQTTSPRSGVVVRVRYNRDVSATCRNCGTAVGQHYCPNCGQEVREPGALAGLLGSFFSEFLSLDGKHLRTAGKLFIPGRLTQLYRAGKRASHTTPVRVYFVASLLFFLFVGIPAPDAEKTNVYIDDILVGREEPGEGLNNLQLFSLRRDGALGKFFARFLDPKLDRLKVMDAQELLDRFFAGLERNVPTVLIFFVPVLAVVLKMLYWRRDFFYVDHLVFALHFQSFLFVLFAAVPPGQRSVLESVVAWPRHLLSGLLFSAAPLSAAGVETCLRAVLAEDGAQGYAARVVVPDPAATDADLDHVPRRHPHVMLSGVSDGLR